MGIAGDEGGRWGGFARRVGKGRLGARLMVASFWTRGLRRVARKSTLVGTEREAFGCDLSGMTRGVEMCSRW